MTDLDELLVRIGTVLDDCDASTLPPLPADSPCCDRHTQQCEVPDECCSACPEALALAAFVAEHRAQAAQPIRIGPTYRVTEIGPVVEPPPVAWAMPPNWWRRILRRSR